MDFSAVIQWIQWLEYFLGIPVALFASIVVIVAYALFFKFYKPPRAAPYAEMKAAVNQLTDYVNKNTADLNELKLIVEQLIALSKNNNEDPVKILSTGFRGSRRVALIQIPDSEEGKRLLYWPCTENGAPINMDVLVELAKLGKLPFSKAEPPSTAIKIASDPIALEAPLNDPVPDNPVEIPMEDVDALSKFDSRLKESQTKSNQDVKIG